MGGEYGSTTGKKRKVNWLNTNRLIKAINLTGCNILIISKVDVLNKLNIFKILENDKVINLKRINNIKRYIENKLKLECPFLKNIIYSNNPCNI